MKCTCSKRAKNKKVNLLDNNDWHDKPFVFRLAKKVLKIKKHTFWHSFGCPASVTSICQLIFEARIRPFYSAAIFRWNRALLPPIPTLRRRPVAKGRIVFKTHKLKSFFVDTIGRDKSNAFSLSTKVHLYRMCLETSDALKFCLFFCCFFSLPIRMYDATALHTCFFGACLASKCGGCSVPLWWDGWNNTWVFGK